MRERLCWLAVPIAAYLVITLVLPAANGAAAQPEFLAHAMWVIVGCAIVVAIVAAGTWLANTRTRSRVPTGGKS
jgi:hypothetical protein